MLHKIYHGILELLFPRRCPICDDIVTPVGELICRQCVSKLQYIKEPYCRKCGKSLLDMEREYCLDCSCGIRNYDMGRALYEYECIQKSIYRFKYMGRQEYAKFFGRQIAEQLGEQIRMWKADALIPVPMYLAKERCRGYNQANLLAEEVGACLRIPVYPKFLVRIKPTIPQKELNPQERQNNLKKAFKICTDDVKLEVVIVIDDIYTTGSTINEIAAELKKSGVKHVFFLTLAIGNGL